MRPLSSNVDAGPDDLVAQRGRERARGNRPEDRHLLLADGFDRAGQRGRRVDAAGEVGRRAVAQDLVAVADQVGDQDPVVEGDRAGRCLGPGAGLLAQVAERTETLVDALEGRVGVDVSTAFAIVGDRPVGRERRVGELVDLGLDVGREEHGGGRALALQRVHERAGARHERGLLAQLPGAGRLVCGRHQCQPGERDDGDDRDGDDQPELVGDAVAGGRPVAVPLAAADREAAPPAAELLAQAGDRLAVEGAVEGLVGTALAEAVEALRVLVVPHVFSHPSGCRLWYLRVAGR